VILTMKWLVRGCPRCGGDMFIDKDLDGWYEQCLQCSYRCELKRLEDAKYSAELKDKRLVGTGRE